MIKFYTLWLGQTISLIGSRVTSFSLMLWLWDQTEQAAPLAIMTFISLIAPLAASTFAGVIVDRFTRKHIMIGADIIAGITTCFLILMAVNDQLMIWHIYIVAAINSVADYFQSLSFYASISMIVPKTHYNRANAMNSYLGYYSASIIAPAIAAVLYNRYGLGIIFLQDMATFLFAIGLLSLLTIPQPEEQPANENENWQTSVTFGWRYIRSKQNLWVLLLIVTAIGMCTSAAGALYAPMILAQSNADTYAFLQAFVGVGGVLSAAILTIWKGPSNMIRGIFLGYMLMGVFNMMLAFGQNILIWLPFAVLAGITGPIPGTYLQTLWMNNTEPEVQGRIYATNYLISGVMMGITTLLIGFLADHVFIPLMREGSIFGAGDGAGLSFLYFMQVFILFLIAVAALRIKKLWTLNPA